MVTKPCLTKSAVGQRCWSAPRPRPLPFRRQRRMLRSRILIQPSRVPKPRARFGKPGLPDRFQHQLQRRLHDPIFDPSAALRTGIPRPERSRRIALRSSWLRDPHPTHRLRPVRPRAQRLGELRPRAPRRRFRTLPLSSPRLPAGADPSPRPGPPAPQQRPPVSRPLPRHPQPGLDFAFRSQARRPLGPFRVRHPTDWRFTSRCFPPRLAAARLRSVSGRRASARRGLSPRRPGTRSGARARSSWPPPFREARRRMLRPLLLTPDCRLPSCLRTSPTPRLRRCRIRRAWRLGRLEALRRPRTARSGRTGPGGALRARSRRRSRRVRAGRGATSSQPS